MRCPLSLHGCEHIGGLRHFWQARHSIRTALEFNVLCLMSNLYSFDLDMLVNHFPHPSLADALDVLVEADMIFEFTGFYKITAKGSELVRDLSRTFYI